MIKIATFFQNSKYPGCYTRGTCGRDNRDCTSIAGTNDTTIIFNHSILVQHISGISLAGVINLTEKSTLALAQRGETKAKQTNPALTVPIVNWPVKSAPAVPTRHMDLMLSNQREDLLPDHFLVIGLKYGGDWPECLHREKGHLCS
jgi:hypothetical protein